MPTTQASASPSAPTTAKTAADYYDELFLDVLCLPWAERASERAAARTSVALGRTLSAARLS